MKNKKKTNHEVYLEKRFLLKGPQGWLYESASCWFVLLLGLNISMAEGEEGN